MGMFDRFGEFDSAEGINETAVNLRREGDLEGLEALARENGLYDPDIMDAFVGGDLPYLCDDMTAAIGKLETEAGEVECAEILGDWVEYIKAQCMEDPGIARAVRARGRSLRGCIAGILKWSFGHQTPVAKDILKEAGVTAGKCTLGIPGMATAKRIIRGYYLGKGAGQ